jgi:uncharacterized hydrophobic protein (TIGR00271 family)
MRSTLNRLFDLRHDQNTPDAIDASIRSGIRIGGTNLWILIFAILIASVGLNVNSSAVIIGAMLISPLMGPIIGLGYAAGINDSELIRRAFRSLAIFVMISLATSTAYFLISPLSQPQSELLARTTPTLWDVLIAFFGGAAGIVALTRKEISNVFPGVAIATALMPPLCTAGYGLANADPTYFIGAFYLFAINSVFIAFATLLFVKLLHLPNHVYLDEKVRLRNRALIATAVLGMMLPSAYLAYRLVQNELFNTAAQRLITELDENRQFLLLSRSSSAKDRSILLTLGGEPPPKELPEQLEKRMTQLGLRDTKITVRYAGAERFDVSSLKRELQEDVYRNTLRQLEDANTKAAQLEEENRRLSATDLEQPQLVIEIIAQLPNVKRVTFARGQRWLSGEARMGGVTLAIVESAAKIPDLERTRLTKWLNVRLPNRKIEVLFVGSNNQN